MTEAGGNTAEDHSGRFRDGSVRDGCAGVPLDEREHSVAANQLQEPGWRDGGCDRSVGAERSATGPCVAGSVLPVHVAAEEEGQRYLVDFRLFAVGILGCTWASWLSKSLEDEPFHPSVKV